MEESYSIEVVCANCQGPAKLACKGCRLAVYCGAECQKHHFKTHKSTCKSPLLKESWQPAWATEKRKPAFIGDGPPQRQFGAKKFLWGNVPAFNVLKLQENEGERYEKDIGLLFAASGDPRNIINTIAEVAEEYTGKLSVVINDRDFDVVARNIIIMLIALVIDDEREAADCMLHVWYSSLITTKHSNILTKRILPMIEEVNRKIADKSPAADLAKTFHFGSRSVRIVLKKAGWKALLSFFSAPLDLSAEEAHEIRKNTVLAPERLDYRDRRYLAYPPIRRVCDQRFRSDGVLLPFSYSRKEFDRPNPTFFQSKDWPMMDHADPLESWKMTEILRTNTGPASNDLYGKLYGLIHKVLRKFHRRVAKAEFEVQMLCVDAKDLAGYLKGRDFARIEVSNISDGGWLGIAHVVKLFAPMLQTPSDNCHATLITLFINAVREVGGQAAMVPSGNEMEHIAKYMEFGHHNRPRVRDDPKAMALMCAVDCVRNGDPFFDQYMEWQEFHKVEKTYGVKMKEPHTIIEKWPLKLKLKPGQKGAKEEFDTLFSSGHVGTERYVEWKRMK